MLVLIALNVSEKILLVCECGYSIVLCCVSNTLQRLVKNTYVIVKEIEGKGEKKERKKERKKVVYLWEFGE